jgi:hypothetical protein
MDNALEDTVVEEVTADEEDEILDEVTAEENGEIIDEVVDEISDEVPNEVADGILDEVPVKVSETIGDVSESLCVSEVVCFLGVGPSNSGPEIRISSGSSTETESKTSSFLPELYRIISTG